MNVRVGLIVGREWSFPPKFIEEVIRRDRGVVAEYVTLGGEAMDAASPYRVIIDRISHEVPFYRSYLKHAALQGVASSSVGSGRSRQSLSRKIGRASCRE